MSAIVLRDYQVLCRDGLRRAYAAGARAPLLVAPTGSGKTVLFAHIAETTAAKGRNVLILVHRRELLDQTSRTLEALGVPHGLIAAGFSWRPERVQVASVQTLARRLALLDGIGWRPGLVVIDEAHHVTATSNWGRVLTHWGVMGDGVPPAQRALGLGVTATPERLDGQGLGVACGGAFDALVEGPSVIDLVSRGFLARPVVYAPSTVDEPTGAGAVRGGEFAAAAVAERMSKPTIIGDVISHYGRLVQGAPALVFCANVANAEQVAEAFRGAGFRAASIDGTLEDRERRGRIRDLGAGALQVLTSCEIVSEGTDIPIVAAAVLLRHTMSLGLYLQQVGRALRLYPGKERAMILDHVGNVFRHGLPDDARSWSLIAAKRTERPDAEREPKPPRWWTCEACGGVHRPAPVCPHCGFRYPADGALAFADGELQAVESYWDQVARYEQAARDGALFRSLESFQAEGARRGYKAGWAAHRYAAQEARRVRMTQERAA
jgi:superfamily II DNA or RNA helicase